MNYIAMLALLKALTQEVNLLEVELAQLEVSSSIAVVTTTPIVFQTPTYQWTHPVQTQSESPVFSAAPTQTLTSVQIIGGNVDNAAPVYATNVLGSACVTLFDQNGNLITDASATISDDSLAGGEDQNHNAVPDVYNFAAPNAQCNYKVIVGRTTNYSSGLGYQFDYIPPADGQHTFGVSALGGNDSVEVNSITQ